MDVKNSIDEFQEEHTNNVVLDVKFTQPLLAKEGKITSKLQDRHKHKETMPRSKIAKLSFVVVWCIVSVELLFNVWIEPSLMKDQRGRIWASLIRLFGFMAFVWGVIIMILEGVPFVRMQSLVLIFWAIWMHLKS
ncbi:hypothetical protein QL285_037905 [Trifolium repens]|nr:hypothetical protein QL285_037905 [Trifolium repens]